MHRKGRKFFSTFESLALKWLSMVEFSDEESKRTKHRTQAVMVQHIIPKGFQRVRYHGLQATKTFKKWKSVILEGMKAFGRAVKGTYRIIRVKKYEERYLVYIPFS